MHNAKNSRVTFEVMHFLMILTPKKIYIKRHNCAISEYVKVIIKYLSH
jgi:hypothetical protein